MNLYAIEVTVVATAYVKAGSEDEAVGKLRDAIGEGETLEMVQDDEPSQDFAVCGRSFARMFGDDVADITLSPATTLQPLEDDVAVDLSAEGAEMAADA